ncbi:MAG: two-component regulator propeller domain-containing protein [Melioribacteraceae bacterium]
MLRFIKFSILLLLLLSEISFPQSNFKINQITTENGLVNNTVNCIFQDSHGFIWIGTNNGLQRYDGYNFITYKNNPSDSSSLSNNYVESIIEDTHGFFWIGTVGGALNRFDPKTGKFTHYNIIFNDKNSFPHVVVKNIFIDSNANIWCATPFALSKYNYEEDNFTNYFAGGPTYNPKVIEIINSLRKNNKIIIDAIKVENNENISKNFTVKEKKKFLVAASGEIPNGQPFDYGSIVNSKGKIIWQMNWDKSLNAGGSDKNRICYDIIELDEGQYNLKYVSDNDHSFGNWNLTPPDFPEFWGIQLLELPLSNANYIQKEINKKIIRNGLVSSEVNRIYEFSDGNLWFATNYGISRLNKRTGKFSNVSLSKIVVAICEDTVNKVVYSFPTAGSIIATNESDFKTKEIISKNSFPYRVTSAVEITKGKIWITTSKNGIFELDKNSFKISPLFTEKEKPKNFEMDGLSFPLIDKAGSIWLPTTYSGVYILNRNKENFKNLFAITDDKEKISIGTVSALYNDNNGNIILGTEGKGLYLYNSKTQSLKNFQFTDNTSNNLPNQIYKIYRDSKENLWIGTGNGIIKFNPKTGTTNSDLNKFTNIKNAAVYSIYEDEDGFLWYGSGDQLVKYDLNTNKEKIYHVTPPTTFVIPFPSITGIIPHDNDKLWILTWWGLFSFDKNNKQWTFYKDVNEKFPISNQYWALAQDKDGMLWLGSLHEGLKSFNPKTKQFYKYTLEAGLPSDRINSIVCLDDNKFWVGSEKGLTLFDKKKKTFINYSKTDGLPSNNFFRNSFSVSPSGELFFGTDNGVLYFDPQKISLENYLQNVQLSNLKIFNKFDPSGKLFSYSNEIKLEYDQNVFSFSFSSLNYITPSKDRYKYKLEGFDSEWIDAGKRNEVTYTNLDPGEYKFEVIGFNDGLWDTYPLEIAVIISPPWYRTWWAYLFYVALFSFLYLWVRRYELNKIKLQNDLRFQKLEADKLKETDRIKSNFFANISHEFRTPLTLILEPVENLIIKTNDFKTKKTLEMVHRNSKRLLQLINQLLDLSKLESGRMKLAVIKKDFVPFFKGIASSFDSLSQAREIDFKVVSSIDSLYTYFDPDKIQKIINNLVSNAIKFTPKGGEVICELFTEENRIIMKVSDTGIGIKEENRERIFDRFYQVDSSKIREHEGSGIGLALTKELVEIHKGKIKLLSNQSSGSIFIVSIPIDDSFYSDCIILDELELDEEYIISSANEEPNIITNQVDYQNRSVILLVEDNSDMRKFIVEVLSPHFNILEAINGEEGINEALEKIPDLIISDVMMPIKDGYQLCKEIKSNSITSHIPVILLTAKAAIENKLEGLETGADDYLIKPFNSTELVARIRNLIALRGNLQKKLLSEISKQNFSDFADYNGLTKLDKGLITKIVDAMEKKYSDPEYDVIKLGDDLGYSSSTLRRKMSALLNKSPNEFIRHFRLQKALKLITEDGKNVSEAAFESGFNSVSYFSKCFTDQFGKNPSELIK